MNSAAPTVRAVPKPTPDTMPFWEATARGELSIPRCLACNKHIFYPRTHCPMCFSRDVEWVVVSGRATLYSYVIINHPAPGFDAPYVVAIVALEEGPRMMSNIVGVPPTPEALELDMELHVVFGEQGDMTLPFFTPTRGGS